MRVLPVEMSCPQYCIFLQTERIYYNDYFCGLVHSFSSCCILYICITRIVHRSHSLNISIQLVQVFFVLLASSAVQRKVYYLRLSSIVITDFQHTSYILFKRFNFGLKIFFKTSILIKDRELPLGLTKSNCVLPEGVLSVLSLKVLYAVALQYKETTLIKETLHVNKI